MAAAVPTVVDAVEKVARDDNAPARDRIRAFEAVARAVYPVAGWDHVGRQAFADAAGQQDGEIQDLLRVPRKEVEQRIVASLVDDAGLDPGDAERLIELWYVVAGGTVGRDPRADLATVMEDLWRAAVGIVGDEPPPPEIVDEPDEADVVPLKAIETTATEKAPSPDPVMSELVDELARKGWTLAEALALVRGDEIDDGGDGGD
jgi:hypothetical protein